MQAGTYVTSTSPQLGKSITQRHPVISDCLPVWAWACRTLDGDILEKKLARHTRSNASPPALIVLCDFPLELCVPHRTPLVIKILPSLDGKLSDLVELVLDIKGKIIDVLI